jgi:phage shock protein C
METQTQHKKLYRSKTKRVFAGVCGGLAEYTNTDPTVLRLIWTLIVIFTGFVPGLLVYLLAVVIIPEQS